MKRVAILGSTGSIGQSALDVVATHADRLRIVALAAGGNSARFAEQVERFRPDTIAMAGRPALDQVQAELRRHAVGIPPHVVCGAEGLIAVASHPEADIVLFASAGTAGLEAVLAAIEAGKTIALANKEILVMAGAVVMEAAARKGVAVLPVDSEHNAIHQCVDGRSLDDVRRLILTASGGPFRGASDARLAEVTAEDALRHPTWTMGPKITIDSATLMNKGLEVIEARWLFGVGADRIAVVVHPQSVVHSMVEFVDGSILAQLGVTDMRLPIQYAFAYPERWAAPVPPLDLVRAGRLDFEEPDLARFPCLDLAFQALRAGGGVSIVLNAANEVAVSAFLDNRIGFQGIPRLIRAAMETYDREGGLPVGTLDEVRAVDRWARAFASDGLQSGIWQSHR